MNVLELQFKSPGQLITSKDWNAVVAFLKGFTSSNRLILTNAGPEFSAQYPEERYLNIKFNEDYDQYSIFLVDDPSGANDFRPDIPVAGDNFTSDPLDALPGQSLVYATNGTQPVTVGMSYDCFLLGNHRPHLIKYTGADPFIGAKMDYVPLQKSVQLSTVGPFAVVGEPDTDRKLVWIVVRNFDKPEIPWVRTTTNDIYPVYPSDPSNVFLVERGKLGFTEIPGNQLPTFIPFTPKQYFIAFHSCGYLDEGTIVRMSYDQGQYYLFPDCPFEYNSSSSSDTPSSSSSEQPSSSSTEPSSSDQQSSSQQPSSSQQASSSQQTSSSDQQSSSQQQSSDGDSSSSVGVNVCCNAVWTDNSPFPPTWAISDGCGTLPECPDPATCTFDPPLPSFGDYIGQVINGECI